MKTKYLLAFSQQFNDRINFLQSWIQKKEVSIWAATVLYIAIFGFSLSVVLKQTKPIELGIAFFILFAMFIIALIFIAFIYSQFSVWIYSSVLIKTLRRGVIKLTFHSEEIEYKDLENDLKLDLPIFLVDIYKEEQAIVNQFHENKRSLKIIWFTFRGISSFFLRKTWREKLGKNREKQEGLIYCLLIFIYICFFIITLIQLDIYKYIKLLINLK